MINLSEIKKVPKIDLHRHLEGSLRLDTLVDIARKYNLDVPKTRETLRPYVQVTTEPPNAFTFLAKFEVLRNFYQTPDVIKRFVREAIEDAARDNVKYLELRFSPQALSRVRHFALASATDWVIEATEEASREFDIDVRLIITLVRHNSLLQARQVAKIAKDRLGRGIVGLDLAGNEINFPAEPFTPIFQDARKAGLGVTIHAGEWMGAETVRQAINDLGAQRIGHGTRTREDKDVLDLVRRNDVSLEICLTSNLQTNSIQRIIEHPLRDFIEADVDITLNTDDPTMSNIVLSDEYWIAAKDLQLTLDDLRNITFSALKTAFLTPVERNDLKRKFTDWWTVDPWPNGSTLAGWTKMGTPLS